MVVRAEKLRPSVDDGFSVVPSEGLEPSDSGWSTAPQAVVYAKFHHDDIARPGHRVSMEVPFDLSIEQGPLRRNFRTFGTDGGIRTLNLPFLRRTPLPVGITSVCDAFRPGDSCMRWSWGSPHGRFLTEQARSSFREPVYGLATDEVA